MRGGRAGGVGDGDSQKGAWAGVPSTPTSINNFALLGKEIGWQTEALNPMDECAQLRRRVLGFNRPLFLSSFAALSTWRTEAVRFFASSNGQERSDLY